MAVPLVVLVGHHIAMGPAMPSCCCSLWQCIWIRAPSAQQARRPLLPALPYRCHERECVTADEYHGSLGHHAVGLSGDHIANRHHYQAVEPWGSAPSPLPLPTSAAALLPWAWVSSYGGSTRRFVLMLLFSFLFLLLFYFLFWSEIGLHRAVHRRIVVDTPEDEVVTVPSQAAVLTLVIKPPMLSVLVTLALDSSPRLLLQACGHHL